MEWLRSLPKPVGLMAGIDERSQQIAEACKAAALSVPDQVAILGVDNDEIICHLSNIPLSSVALTAERGGYEAAELLVGAITHWVSCKPVFPRSSSCPLRLCLWASWR